MRSCAPTLQLRRRAEIEAEQAKDRRVAHLTQLAVRRLGKQGLGRGFGAWADAYEEAVRRKRMLQAAGAKLTRPKLVASYAHWRRDWAAEAAAAATMSVAERLEMQTARLAAAEDEAQRLRAELSRAREAAINGVAHEEELRRRQAEEEEAEREKRVEHLGQMAARRMGKKVRGSPCIHTHTHTHARVSLCASCASLRDAERVAHHLRVPARPYRQELSSGWETWLQMYLDGAHRRRLLHTAGAKLTRPKLAAGYAHWRVDWEREEARRRTLSTKERFEQDRQALEAEVRMWRVACGTWLVAGGRWHVARGMWHEA